MYTRGFRMPNMQSAPRHPHEFAPGSKIHSAGSEGRAWRLRSGVVRLDKVSTSGHVTFASLAIAGDILGCETLLFGCYTFRATALTHCRLAPWPEGEGMVDSSTLLASLASSQQRAADVVALRGGQASERVLGLIRLLADQAGRVVLPTRQDIADITDLRFETISRIVKQLQRNQIIKSIRLEGIHATRTFALAEISA
jgi:CRP-like cAMP-binding protein